MGTYYYFDVYYFLLKKLIYVNKKARTAYQYCVLAFILKLYYVEKCCLYFFNFVIKLYSGGLFFKLMALVSYDVFYIKIRLQLSHKSIRS